MDQSQDNSGGTIKGPPRVTVINQLGSAVHSALEDHWSRPNLIDDSSGCDPWEFRRDATVLLTRPQAGWRTAPAQKPQGWPFALRWVQVASTALDFFPGWILDVPLVTVGRGIAAIPIAEYVIAAILLQEKRLIEIRVRTPENWRPASLGSLWGKTIGIAGFGSIGQAVAARLAPFGGSIRVLRRSSRDNADRNVVSVSDIGALVEGADHLVIALPLTDSTVHLINRETLRKAKPTLHIVNVARGRIIDQVALLEALDAGRIGAVTLDVFDPEPPPAGDPVYRHPNVYLTPHISWSGGDSGRLLTEKTLANFNAFVSGMPLTDVFDRAIGY
ncbi:MULTISPECIES: NAD(P)-dependent oxidoreductase [unclassified Bradyrhizobium]|uniref:NAD(P)-dependent oxidoreductase n=1 Tax=unclassified Bradyrhizobium TaxID=2631580 RepID=UPI0028EB0306|nr:MULTISPECIES: NAD(P)-dependent oxidoreductase [unclassified Bradyrhizobium]